MISLVIIFTHDLSNKEIYRLDKGIYLAMKRRFKVCDYLSLLFLDIYKDNVIK